ncbi:MAG TPA: OmpA family protein [Bacteroidia bacterium]|nr:OmpA family protein [Bacteroidia bacterium]
MSGIRISWVWVVLLLAMCGTVAGQTENNVLQKYSLDQLKRLGKRSAELNDFSSAAMYYEEFCKRKPTDYKVIYQLAESYRLAKEYRSAQDAYLKAYNLNPKKNALALFYYAEVQKSLGNYKKADEYFAKFKKEYQGADKSDFTKRIKNYGIAAQFADSLSRNAQKIAIEHLPDNINTSHVESSPFFINDTTIIYGSLKTDQTTFDFNAKDSTSDEPMRKIYVAVRDSDEWKDEGELPGFYNVPGQHTLNGVYSQDKLRFYFTRCKRNNRNKVICAIYVSFFNNGTWTEPVSLGTEVNNPKYTSTQPAIGMNSKKRGEEIIYFVSDKEGGKGGMDIWYTSFDNKTKTYKVPVNAGSKINTPGDEVSPFIDPKTQTLYFSSDGWQGIGGLDIFKTNGEMKKWTQPVNMGVPINSNYDDLYFVVAPSNQDNGLLVSNRPVIENGVNRGSCCDDIFEYIYLDAIHLNGKGFLYEIDPSIKRKKASMIPVRRASILVEMQNREDSTYISLGRTSSDDQGRFNIELSPNQQYRITARKEGYLNEVIALSTMGKTRSGDISIDIHIRAIPEAPLLLTNIYYEFASPLLTQKAKNALDTTLVVFLEKNADLGVEIRSHTDAIGSEESNMILSQKRAESVVDYLVEKGIDPNRLRAKGFGETMPVAPNTKPDGRDNPKGRQLNRRTEFKILGKMRDGQIREETDF